MMVMMKISGVAILLIICMVRTGGAIWLTVPPSGTKCVSEEIQNNVVVLGDYAVVSEDQPHTPTISVKVLKNQPIHIVATNLIRNYPFMNFHLVCFAFSMSH